MSLKQPNPRPAPVTIALTPTMGRGVFAARHIEHGEELGAFHTIRLPPDEVAAMAGSTLCHFWFEDEDDGAAFIVLGWIELVNHSLTPNIDRSWRTTAEGAVVTVCAIADIAEGQQLFIDYKFDAGPGNPSWA